jgi:hypothetical protein
MKIVVVHHYVLPGQLDTAERRIQVVTQRMASRDGMVFRHIGKREGAPQCLTSVTGWRSEKAFAEWDAYRLTLPPIEGSHPYERVEEYAVIVPDSEDTLEF